MMITEEQSQTPESPRDSIEMVSLTQLSVALDLSEGTITRLVEKGELPSPITLGRQKRWLISVVRECLETLSK